MNDKRYNYDFSGLERAMSKLKTKQDATVLHDIQRELNNFFKDSKCKDVIFTKNTDKLFFGMSTFVFIDKYQTEVILTDDKPYNIRSYMIEIDSKLLEIGLTTRELTAIMLHEVGHLVKDSNPTNQVRKAIDTYMAELGTTIDIGSIRDIAPFLQYSIKDTYRKTTSIFNRKDDEIIADEFVFMCGYGDELESAFKKIVHQGKNTNANVNRLIALDWTLRIYKNIAMNRLQAIRTLNNMKKLTGSKLQQREMEEAIKCLNTAKLDSIRETTVKYESIHVIGEEAITESEKEGLVYKMQRKGLKGIEEDLYEYQIRIKNVETEEDAMLILRQINTRMSILDDYITTAKDCSEKERARWEKVYNKYYELREVMVKKTIYNKKQYGLWFDYGQIGSDPYR